MHLEPTSVDLHHGASAVFLCDCDPYHILYLLKGYADPYLILTEKSLCKKSYIIVVYCKINVLSAVNPGGTDSDDLTIHIQHGSAGAAVRYGSCELDHIDIFNFPEAGYDSI